MLFFKKKTSEIYAILNLTRVMKKGPNKFLVFRTLVSGNYPFDGKFWFKFRKLSVANGSAFSGIIE